MTCYPTKTPETAEAGEWDFKGACAPFENSPSSQMMETFSLSCFQWVPMARGKKMKHGKTQHRVKGITSDVAKTYQEARDFCARKNAERNMT